MQSADVDSPAKESDVFQLEFQNLSAFKECDSAWPASADALEHVRIVEETAAALLDGWPLQKIDRVCRRRDGGVLRWNVSRQT